MDRRLCSHEGAVLIIWRVRNIVTGLFWNGARWAVLDGVFSELAAARLDTTRELVQLQTCGVVGDKSFRTFAGGERVVGSDRLNAGFRGKPGTVVSYSASRQEMFVQFDHVYINGGHFVHHAEDKIGVYPL